ncbi:uroporphyrinogen-III C-methyltransferase [Bacillus sp. CECT 9360]|uniref:uroporphyrinogen-III C-methyltransferase n=1 Tax=Bacillus sp. CECT 9360 TaxID=2845821 RepID=UPI001E53DCAD|nr:uroporphyrinogen-III C-methyltransferase [Bacillus sp. CECT 9360]CAH0343990.1 Uroporphyrinogen-III C-methyltransferase [Bacillus sp. CECT 9360]
MKHGKVYLVGAGPGDIGLITVKGLEAIRRAEVILYDRLVNPKLLEFANNDCELIYGGKLPDRHILRQETINELLISKALEGKIVVRLKGGDPGVFGRVGEEAAGLAENGIPFEMVPGITSGIAAPMYAGIPVTHREYGGSFAIVTAHDKSKDGKPNLDWTSLAKGIDTIAFYMGVANLPHICENLVKHGKSLDTPVILIQWGTLGRQKTLEGTLSTIAQKVKDAKFSNPAITLVGDVVSIRGKINWFEKKPLFGRQILLARTGTEKSALAAELREQGADVMEYPKWKREAAPVKEQILDRIDSYEKILFGSPESVKEFFELLIGRSMDIRKIKAELFASSIKSKKALNERGFSAEIVDKMNSTGNLLIIGDNTVESNEQYLMSQYGEFDMFQTSQKQLDEQFIPIFLRTLEEVKLDTIVFPSSASVQQFIEGLKTTRLSEQEVIKDLKVICMGNHTYEAAIVNGLKPNGMPSSPTYEALVDFLVNQE